MENRDIKGRFIKGISYSPNTQFKVGQHWRNKKLFWSKSWLYNEYITNNRSAIDISLQFSVTDSAIIYWLNKHGIQCRSMEEIRSRKYWGLPGEKNSMYGKRKDKNPNWRGGVSKERQSFYSSLEWKECSKLVWERDKARCRRCKCGVGRESKKQAIHHVVSFAVKKLRAELTNLVLLCRDCHRFIHSKLNINNKYLMSYEQFNTRQ